MRGILWKWLIFLGVLFWMALCTVDYYREKIVTPPKTIEILLIDEKLTASPDHMFGNTKIPPALTFWKTLSMILSLSALVYIKRSSTLKKGRNLMLPYIKSEDILNIRPPSPQIYSISPTSIYYKEFPKSITSPADRNKQLLQKNNVYNGGMIGVEIVQKKLESLEKSVASLRKRQYAAASNTTFVNSSRMVSGSPEFKKFLAESQSNLQQLNFDQHSQISNSSSSQSRSFDNRIISTVSSSSSSKFSLKRNSRGSKVSLIPISISNTQNKVNKRKSSEKVFKSTEDESNSSWMTISGDSNLEPSEQNVQSIETKSSIQTITKEILRKKESFSDSSRLSDDVKMFDHFSYLPDNLENFVSDEEVPGSNLIDSASASSCSSITLLSNNLPSFAMDESSSCSFDLGNIDSLNTLD